MASTETPKYPSFFYVTDPEERAELEQRDRDGDWDLEEHEKWWRRRFNVLEQHGYEVRARYRPDWTPSWRGSELNPMLVEDSIQLPSKKIMDARRKADGHQVCIKHVQADTEEISIALFLSDSTRRSDPRNHSIPILDYFTAEVEGREEHYLVMPLLRPFDSPPFFVVSEAVDFMRQTLEGLAYLHENGIAHRDFCVFNIMMDGTMLYPDGFHPVVNTMNRDVTRPAVFLQRSRVRNISYYIADFGISTHFKDPSQPRRVTGVDCQDRAVPELSELIPYDPYAVDIFTLGNVYKKNLLEEYTSLGAFEPLINVMLKRNPSDRPTVSEAMDMFNGIIQKMRPYELRWRMHWPGMSLRTHLYVNLYSIAREWKYLWNKVTCLMLSQASRIVWFLGCKRGRSQ